MSSPYSTTPQRSGFFRKLAALVAFVTGITGFMVILNYHQTNISSFLMSVFAVLGIGLAAGAGARTVFFEWPGFVRYFLTLLVLPLGLFILGFYTNWKLGIGPLDPWIEGVIDWMQLIRLGSAFLVALLALEAWWKPLARRAESPPPDLPRSSRNDEWEVVRPSRQPAFNRPVVQPLNRTPRLKFAARPRTGIRAGSGREKLILAHTAVHTRSRGRRQYKRKPNLQISMYEEHRCPYCLEIVKPNDPRGVRKCEVCNALHHADCWEITGFCQVPHLNT